MGKRGLLIAIEGIDGTGKSTQVSKLAEYLTGLGHQVVMTREPTDGPYGRRLRSMFAERDKMSPDEELDLFMNDRRQHVAELIVPALAAGKIVLTDRYYFSTVAYQGAAGHDPGRILADNEAFAPVPDLVILINLDPAESVRRIREGRGEGLNDFEQEELLRRVAGEFDRLDRDFIARVDGSGSPETVHEEIVARVNSLLGNIN